jgi:RND family efflux transporter MFP subunit
MMLAVCGTLCGTLCGCNDSNAQVEQQTLLEKKGKPKVHTVQVELKDFQETIEASGMLMPARHTRLTTLVGGKVETIRVDIGDRVAAGDVLFQVRTVDYELALKQAEAALARAQIMVKDRKREMTRIENLFRGGSATDQMRDHAGTAVEDAGSGLQQAVAARDRARQSLADCTIKAPYAGTITAKNVQAGEFAKMGTEVLEIMDLATLNAELNVSERYAGKIGLKADVKIVPSSSATPIDGNIAAVNPKIDLNTRTFLVKVSVDNADGSLQAGRFCSARFLLPVSRQQTAIPASALIRDQGKSSVWIIENNTANLQEVVDKGIYDGWAWIAGGCLKAGQRVVRQGAAGLLPGVEVELI